MKQYCLDLKETLPLMTKIRFIFLFLPVCLFIWLRQITFRRGVRYKTVRLGNSYIITSDEKCSKGDEALWTKEGFRKIIQRVTI